MRRVSALLAAVSLATAAHAGKKKDADPEVVIVVAPAIQPPVTGVFTNAIVGFDAGGLPHGLPSLSAQSCNACHYEAHDSWQRSAHSGPGSAAWAKAVAEIGNPTCTACHLPLQSQRPRVFGFDAGDATKVLTEANAGFDATLHLEGVTCAACHVRDGKVVSGRAVSTPPAAHAGMVWSPDVGSAEGCASCHQLTWPGAAAPLYDTYGEWKRSDYAAAGVSCTTCHFAAGAEDGAVRHELSADLARALTVEIGIAGLKVARGGPALEMALTLTNTGAGHAVPTGSPWRALRVEILLEAPGKDGPIEVARTDTLLGRTPTDTAPWMPGEDTRLSVAERRRIDWSGALPADAPSGPWTLVVRIREVVRGEAASQAALERRLLLVAD